MRAPTGARRCGCRVQLMLGHETCPVQPDFPEPHFDLDVSLYLPWVLDEPVEGPQLP